MKPDIGPLCAHSVCVWVCACLTVWCFAFQFMAICISYKMVFWKFLLNEIQKLFRWRNRIDLKCSHCSQSLCSSSTHSGEYKDGVLKIADRRCWKDEKTTSKQCPCQPHRMDFLIIFTSVLSAQCLATSFSNVRVYLHSFMCFLHIQYSNYSHPLITDFKSKINILFDKSDTLKSYNCRLINYIR